MLNCFWAVQQVSYHLELHSGKLTFILGFDTRFSQLFVQALFVYGCKARIATSFQVSSSEAIQDLGCEQANHKHQKYGLQLRLDNCVYTCF